MITCFILLHSTSAIERLSVLLDSVPGFCIVGISTSLLSGSMKLYQAEPDIVFISENFYAELDGQIGSYNVVRLTETPASGDKAPGVLCSSVLSNRESFLMLIHSIAGKHFLNRQAVSGDFFYLQTGIRSRRNKVFFEEIYFIESLSNYSKVHCKEETYTVYCSLKELVKALPAGNFRRIHKSYIVNMNCINATEGNRVFLSNGKELSIGRLYKDAFCRLLDHHTLKPGMELK